MSVKKLIINWEEQRIFDKRIYYYNPSANQIDTSLPEEWICELIVRNSQLQPTSAIIPTTITTLDNENIAVHYTPTSAITYAIAYCFDWNLWILNTDLSGTYNN